eukprot:GHVP01057578.1.p1 GENE.GHVP01057578.1~~GHVP01057578.1.p1  ORF type:complete len:121 (+),score=6.94 GHVP01057578.1:1-363(+)
MCNSLNRSTRSLPASSETFSFSRTMAGCIILALASSLCYFIPSSQKIPAYPGKRSKNKFRAPNGQEVELWASADSNLVPGLPLQTASESRPESDASNPTRDRKRITARIRRQQPDTRHAP